MASIERVIRYADGTTDVEFIDGILDSEAGTAMMEFRCLDEEWNVMSAKKYTATYEII